MPSPGGQTSGIARHQDGHRLGQVGGCDIPPASLKGLPHASPGAEPDNARAGIVEGCPRVDARLGYARPTGCHTTPTSKIASDPLSG